MAGLEINLCQQVLSTQVGLNGQHTYADSLTGFCQKEPLVK